MDILTHIQAQPEGLHLARAKFSDVAARMGVSDIDLIQTLEPALRDALLTYQGPVHLTTWKGPLGEGTLHVALDGSIRVKSTDGTQHSFPTAAAFIEAGYERVEK